MDITSAMQIPVCRVFSHNGFQIEYMPDFLDDKDFDNYSPHVHSFYEILWFEEVHSTGSAQVSALHTVDFTEYAVKPNTIFFLAPGQMHHFDHNIYKGVSIKICTDFMKSEECHCSLFLKYDVFHSFDSIPCFQVDEATAKELKLLISQMEDESVKHSEFGNAEMLQSLLRMFLIKVYRNGVKAGKFQLDELKSSHQLFVRFRSMVEKEYQHKHTVQEYAKSLNTNVRTLNKCVNDCAGISPLTFINQRLMLEAKRLVRYTNLMIKEIAFTLGYDDPSYFVRIFKRNTGYMPTEFREAGELRKS